MSDLPRIAGAADPVATPALDPLAGPAPSALKLPERLGKKRFELVRIALHNPKLVVGLGIVASMLLIAIAGPALTAQSPLAFGSALAQGPSSAHWFGTTQSGQDVFSQFVYGLRASFVVGALGGGVAALIGMAVGFTAGYRGGIVDEILNLLTNVVLVVPTFAVLITIAAYVKTRGFAVEGLFIGATSWPWAARAVRAQTFSLASREFVDIARLSGRPGRKIIVSEIAPNMTSYLLMMFILLFGGSILIGATLDFIGLGPSNAISLGLMMNEAVLWSALLLGYWWWFIPPGIGIMLIVGGLYVMNVGLDEVFNPRLREM